MTTAGGHDPAATVSIAASPTTHQTDPRAVRVALAPSSAHADLPPAVVEPVPVPVAPVPSVIGRGLLGGAATPVPAVPHADVRGPDDVLVDGVRVRAAIVAADAGHAILLVESHDTPPDTRSADVAADGVEPWPPGRTRLLLEPSEPLPDGRGVLRREIVVDGWRIELDLESERRAALRDRARRGREESARGGPTEVHAIIPGRVVSVSVVPGEAVVASQQLLVVEAMKMQNELRAPRDGVISRVGVAPGDTIEIGDLLLVIE
jgi:hypothetical protein